MKVVVDSREASFQPKIVEGLKEAGIEVWIEILECGDYYIPAGEKSVIIERKTSNDFVSSVRTRRLWEELDGLKRAEARPLLLIEGSLSVVEDLTDWAPQSICGIISSVIFDYGVPVVVLPSRRWTIIYITTLAKGLTSPKTRIHPLRVKEKVERFEDYPICVLEGLPGVSGKRARDLLKHFKTVRNVANASIESLAEVNGIGPKLAEKIYKVFNLEFS
ncbi:MAG: ERCC4 domain-containing protein [Thermoproteota archaeon]